MSLQAVCPKLNLLEHNILFIGLNFFEIRDGELVSADYILVTLTPISRSQQFLYIVYGHLMLLSEKLIIFVYFVFFRLQVTSVLIPILMLVLKLTPSTQKVRNKELFHFVCLKQSDMP